MEWDIINIQDQPKCDFCGYTTRMMARFNVLIRPNYPIYICSICARHIKEAMNKWTELKSTNWLPDTTHIQDCMDKLIEENKDKAALFPEVDPDDEMKSLDPSETGNNSSYYRPNKRLL